MNDALICSRMVKHISELVTLLVCRWMVGGARNETFLFRTLGEFANHSYTYAREWLAMQVCGCVLHGCVISCHAHSLSSVHTVLYGWKFSWLQIFVKQTKFEFQKNFGSFNFCGW